MVRSCSMFHLTCVAMLWFPAGGRVDQDISLATVERYNPAIDEWETVSPLSTARRSIAVAGHNGRLYAMGGSGLQMLSQGSCGMISSQK